MLQILWRNTQAPKKLLLHTSNWSITFVYDTSQELSTGYKNSIILYIFADKMAKAILSAKSVNVNMSITTESLSINDLLENIEFLTRLIITRKRKNKLVK